MLTLPRNGRNGASEELKCQNFLGEDSPQPPYKLAPFTPLSSNLMLKTWICPRNTQIFPVKVLELEPCVYEPLWYRLANPQKGKNVRF